MLSIAGYVITATAVGGTFEDVVERDIAIVDNRGGFLAAWVVQSIAVGVLALVLRYLYRATKYRRDALPRGVWPLATYAPPLLAVTALLGAFQRAEASERVVARLPLPPEAAIELSKDEATTGGVVFVSLLGSLAALSVAAALILTSQNARKAGLLSNFIGIIGIIVGVFIVFGPLVGELLGPIPIVQWFFLGSLAALFLGRWPGGRPPAWETGEEEPWPTAQEIREQRAAEAPPEPEPEPEPDEEPAPATPQHPRSKKRKKKRKR